MSKAFYLTTPLYYVNDVPHVGHAYTTIIGDALARYKRMCGQEVCFLSGTDEHGLKIERAAQAKGVTPDQLTEANAAAFAQAWDQLGIGFDEFIRTTQPRHHRVVRDVFRRIKQNGHIYLGNYKGQYCVRCEAYVMSGAETCPDCGNATESIQEDSYFFKLSAFQDKLLAFYRDKPQFVLPQTRMNEIVSFVRRGLKDVSISRTSFKWGIPVPGDRKHILYVWFDALHGYLSGIDYATGDKKFKRFWPAAVQLMGKDILRFHGIYWPAFLMAAGLEPPRQLLVHGWWTINGKKMSKSAGNFITVEALARALPRDYLKYFLLREISLGADGNFGYDALLRRSNSDLANDLGNLSSRILKMISNYFDDQVPESTGLENPEEELIGVAGETTRLYRQNFDKLEINKALENVWELISFANKYLVANEPWRLSQDRLQRRRLQTVLYSAAEALRIISLLLNPILPDGTAKILRQLGIDKPGSDYRIADLNWGGLQAGTRIGQVEPVYPRLTRKQFLTALKTNGSASAPRPVSSPSATEERIEIADFARVDLRVGRIVEASPIPGSSKLLKLQVNIGDEVRQLVAGLGKAYTPESLLDRLVVVVANLKTVKLMGVESNGMIVAASVEGKPVLAGFNEAVEIGSRLK